MTAAPFSATVLHVLRIARLSAGTTTAIRDFSGAFGTKLALRYFRGDCAEFARKVLAAPWFRQHCYAARCQSRIALGSNTMKPIRYKQSDIDLIDRGSPQSPPVTLDRSGYGWIELCWPSFGFCGILIGVFLATQTGQLAFASAAEHLRNFLVPHAAIQKTEPGPCPDRHQQSRSPAPGDRHSLASRIRAAAGRDRRRGGLNSSRRIPPWCGSLSWIPQCRIRPRSRVPCASSFPPPASSCSRHPVPAKRSAPSCSTICKKNGGGPRSARDAAVTTPARVYPPNSSTRLRSSIRRASVPEIPRSSSARVCASNTS